MPHRKFCRLRKKSNDTSKRLSDAFDSLHFSFKRIAKEVATPASADAPQQTTGTSQGSVLVATEVQPPLTTDNDVFEKMKGVFEDAQAALERICRDIMKLVSKTIDDTTTSSTLFLVVDY